MLDLPTQTITMHPTATTQEVHCEKLTEIHRKSLLCQAIAQLTVVNNQAKR